MRLISRQEFLKLPGGTVYAKHLADSGIGDMESLCVKGESLNDDWYYQEVTAIDYDDSNEFFAIVDRAEKDSGFEFNCDPFTWSRDGLFDESDRFFVFSKDDVEKIITALQTAIK